MTESKKTENRLVIMDRDDAEWLLERAQLAEELDTFCTTHEDQSRLNQIRVSFDRFKH